MPNSWSQLQLGYGAVVPNTGIPLAHINIPTIKQMPVVDAAEHNPYNISGIVSKFSGASASISVLNSVVSMGVTGILNINKITDSTFENGLTNWTNSINASGSTTGGRTSLNSTYDEDTTDVPAYGQPGFEEYCAYHPWESTASGFTIGSDLIAARAGAETSYSKENVAYQLTFWIATDPVDDNHMRRNGTNSINAENTRISIFVDGTDSGGGFVEQCHQASITYFNPNTQHYLLQPTKRYLKVRSGLFRCNNAATEKLRVRIVGYNSKGIYVDDVVLTSYAYVPHIRINTGDAPVNTSTTTTTVYGGLESIGTIANNAYFADNSIENLYYSEIGVSAINLLENPGFEAGGALGTANYWVPTTWNLSGAVRRSTASQYSSPRTGEWLLALESDGASAAQTITVDYTKVHTAECYYKHEDVCNITDSKLVMVAQALTSTDALVATFSATGTAPAITPTNPNIWQKLALSLPITTFPTVAKIRLSLITPTATTAHIVVDDVSLSAITSSKGITDWQIQPGTNYWPDFYNVLTYNTKNDFYAGVYDTTIEANRHYLAPLREKIFDGKRAFITISYCNQYWNTQDILTSSKLTVTPGNFYQIETVFGWPENTVGAQQIDTLFSRPFLMEYKPETEIAMFTWTAVMDSIVKVNEYGSIQIACEFFDSSDISLANYEVTNISHQNGNLPKEKSYDSIAGWFYTEGVKANLIQAPAGASYAVITAKFRGTNCGIKSITLAEFQNKTTQQTGSYTYTGLTAGNKVQIYTFTDQIKIDGIEQDLVDAWLPLLKDGIFEQPYIVQTYEPTGGLLYKMGCRPGDHLKLIYTVPEYSLDAQYSNELHLGEVYQLEAEPIDEHTIYLKNRFVKQITYLTINGTIIVSGSPTDIINLPTIYEDIVSVSSKNGTITFGRAISTKDDIIVSYTYEQRRYIYRGYYDDGTWYDIDLNPAADHRFHIGVDGNGRPTSDLVNNGITIYAIPTAAYNASGDISGIYEYRSAMSIPTANRPTSFIKHIIGTDVDDLILTKEPYAIILAKIFIPPPASLSDINVLDIRTRGGGLPENWEYTPIFTEEVRTKLSEAGWKNQFVDLAPGDRLEIWGMGILGTVSPSGTLFGTTAATLPSSGTAGFHIGNYYTTVITAETSGTLFARINNPSYTTGDMYLKILVHRKTTKKGRWDTGSSWDGEPVMLNGVVVIDVPSDVLTGANGYRQLTAEEVNEAVHKHVAAGVLPIVRFI